MPVSTLMGVLAIVSWPISTHITLFVSSSLGVNRPVSAGMAFTLLLGKSCLSCDHPLCRRWLRLLLMIDGQNYGLDLPQRLIPAYRDFLNSARITTVRAPLNVLATLSLESKGGVWTFSIHKA